jgi:PAS domain S-box-containing protein
MTDITDRQQTELLLVEHNRLLELVAMGRPLDECLTAICRAVAQLSPGTRACIRQTDARSIAPDLPPAFSHKLTDLSLDELVLDRTVPMAVTDLATDQRQSSQWQKLCRSQGILAYYTVPILGIDRQPLGVLMLCFDAARSPTEWETKVAELGTKIASIVGDRDRAHQHRRDSEERLNLVLAEAEMASGDADATEAETNLAQSNARFEAAMRAVRGIVFEWNLQTQHIYRSAGLFELLGIRAEDAPPTNQWWMERVHPDDLARTQAEFKAAPAGIERFESEYRVRHAAGHWVDVVDRNYFQYAADGQLLKVVGFTADISDRKQVEENLRQSQALAQQQLMESEAIYQTAPIGLAILDLELRFVRINQRLAEINGIPIADHIGRTIHEIVPDLADLAEPLFRQVLVTGEPLHDLELSGQTKAQPGVCRTWLENCYPLWDASGEIVGINVVVQDITDRKRAEAELARVNGILTATIDGTSDVIYVKDLQGRYIIVNTTAAEWLDARVADILGRDDTSLFPPEIAARIALSDRQVITTGESIVYEEELPKQGTRRALLSAKYPWRDPQGAIVGVIGISRDITERQQAEAALAERNRSLDSFVHTVSHDLKAPLRAIANLAEWLTIDLEGRLPPENQQQFELLRSRVKRMDATIDSLLRYSRAGRQQAPLETVNVAELLAEIIDTLAPPQSFTISIASILPTLTTKRIFLSQVFANLISNAIDHHPTAAGQIDITAIERPDCYEFSVRDDGAGIAPEHHERVFGIFQTLKSRDNTENTGVGLAIVKKIIETERGTIRLESALGQGATFSFTWPKYPG